MEGIYDMDIKNNLVSNWLGFKYPHCIFDIGTTILYLLMLMCIVVAIGSFIQKDVSLGIEALVLSFLLSPYGIPMVGAAVIGFIQGINQRIKSV